MRRRAAFLNVQATEMSIRYYARHPDASAIPGITAHRPNSDIFSCAERSRVRTLVSAL